MQQKIYINLNIHKSKFNLDISKTPLHLYKYMSTIIQD